MLWPYLLLTATLVLAVLAMSGIGWEVVFGGLALACLIMCGATTLRVFRTFGM